MAENTINIVEKNIAFKISQQFPAYYKQEGPELVSMVEHYYKFVESEPTMGVYNTRRLFEYRDVGTTLAEMLIYFKKKFMADLPPLDDDDVVRFVIKNIMDLYRRKGTESGLVLFFRMFYQEDIQVNYPAKYMFKPSDSNWKTGTYLQMYSNNNEFYSSSGVFYNYKDLLSRNIYGSISKAKAVVDKINFVYLNNVLVPIIYITGTRGVFAKYDDIITRIGGEDVSFGKLNGSANSLRIDTRWGGTTGNKIGDIFSLESIYGRGGTAVVTNLQDEFTGTVEYTLTDGGAGYTVQNTKLLVSNQVIVLNNEDFRFKELEVLQDSAGNQGTVIGQNSAAVGVLMEPGNSFDISRSISTVDRGAENFTISAFNSVTQTGNIFTVSTKNDSSPGALYANTGVITDARVEELANIESVTLITDLISNFLSVPLNSANFNAVPPALVPMSGVANPITLESPLQDAFNLTPFDIGTIKSFININPGADYTNDTFTLVRDEQMLAFERYAQIIVVDNYSARFSVGDIINQPQTGATGLITHVDNDLRALYVRPYSYYGFRTGNTNSFNHKGTEFSILSVQIDYSSAKMGESAIVENRTLFSQGVITQAEIRNSGLGYIDGEEVYLIDENKTRHAKAIIGANSQGITAGFWSSQNSHLNGYLKTAAGDGVDEYYDSEMRIQDSDYYQEYSYEIQSIVDIKRYEKVLEDTVHLAGTKPFGKFVFQHKTGPFTSAVFRLTVKDDFIIGGPDIVGPDQDVGDQTIRADNFIQTVDTLAFTVDNG